MADNNHLRCLEEGVLWIENVDWTHIVLASDKYYKKFQNKLCSSIRRSWDNFNWLHFDADASCQAKMNLVSGPP